VFPSPSSFSSSSSSSQKELNPLCLIHFFLDHVVLISKVIPYRNNKHIQIKINNNQK
jgi:hypothetical protein